LRSRGARAETAAAGVAEVVRPMARLVRARAKVLAAQRKAIHQRPAVPPLLRRRVLPQVVARGKVVEPSPRVAKDTAAAAAMVAVAVAKAVGSVEMAVDDAAGTERRRRQVV
jgi:hypothetical protein